jgi:hypothetical protein
MMACNYPPLIGGINATSSLLINMRDESIAIYSILTATTMVDNNGVNAAYRAHINVTHDATVVPFGIVIVWDLVPTTSLALANNNTLIVMVDDVDDVLGVVVAAVAALPTFDSVVIRDYYYLYSAHTAST